MFAEFCREHYLVAEMNEPGIADIFYRHGWEILGLRHAEVKGPMRRTIA